MTVAEARRERPVFGGPSSLDALAILRLAAELEALRAAAVESAADEGLTLPPFADIDELGELGLRRRIGLKGAEPWW